jgi:hypothetical protein
LDLERTELAHQPQERRFSLNRITIAYGGNLYTVADSDVDELKTQTLAVHTSGTLTWHSVNHAEGSYRKTDLLIAPGISVALTEIDAE